MSFLVGVEEGRLDEGEEVSMYTDASELVSLTAYLVIIDS